MNIANMNTKKSKILAPYLPIFDAVVQLMQPLVEIVVHDLRKNSIAYVSGGLSARGVNDPSLLAREELDEDGFENITYSKLNFDGRLVKSISVKLDRDWLVCINCDVSVFSHMEKLSQQFLVRSKHKPKSLFKDDWQERLHVAIHDFLNQHSWTFAELSRTQKKAIVHHLYEQGAFKEKNAADYVAKVLKTARATVFNYLREGRNK